MDARVEVHEEGKEVHILRPPTPTGDLFIDLATPGAIHATVGFTIGTSQDFGKLKVVAYVSMACDQTEATINRAGELTFLKATELMNDGLATLVGRQPVT